MQDLRSKRMKNFYLTILFSIVFTFSVAAETLSKDSFVNKYNEATNLYYKGQYELALGIFDTLVNDDYSKTNPAVFLRRSLTLYALGKYEDAKKDIEICLELSPLSIKPLFCRSLINTALKDYDSALADVDYCLEKDYFWADAHQLRGEIYLYKKNYYDALNEFEKAISISGDSHKAEYFSDRGFAHYYLQAYDKAKEDFLYSLAIAEKEDVYLCLVDVCYKLQQYDEGIKYANILISRGQRSDEAIIERAYIYLVQERYDEVKRDLDSLKKSCDDKPAYHKVKGIYFILKGDMNSASKELDKAQKLNPNDTDVLLLQEALNSNETNIQTILNSKIHSYNF